MSRHRICCNDCQDGGGPQPGPCTECMLGQCAEQLTLTLGPFSLAHRCFADVWGTAGMAEQVAFTWDRVDQTPYLGCGWLPVGPDPYPDIQIQNGSGICGAMTDNFFTLEIGAFGSAVLCTFEPGCIGGEWYAIIGMNLASSACYQSEPPLFLVFHRPSPSFACPPEGLWPFCKLAASPGALPDPSNSIICETPLLFVQNV